MTAFDKLAVKKLYNSGTLKQKYEKTTENGWNMSSNSNFQKLNKL